MSFWSMCGIRVTPAVMGICALLLCGNLAAQGMAVSKPTALPLSQDSVPAIIWASSPQDNPDIVLVCTTENDSRHGRTPSVAYVSFDGGSSWVKSIVDLGNIGWVTETACASDTQGRAYFVDSASGTASDSFTHHASGSTRIFRSTDGGLSWSIIQRVPFLDWNLLTIDQASNRTSHRMFLFGNEIARGVGDEGSGQFRSDRQPLLVANDDDAAGFSEPMFPLVDGQVAHVDGTKTSALTVPIDAVVLKSGSALALYSDRDTPTGVASIYYAGNNLYTKLSQIQVPDGYRLESGLSGQIAYDRTSGALYVSYVANRNSEDVLVLARSQDQGKTWMNRILLQRVTNLSPEQRTDVSAITGVAVNGNGDVGVEWIPISGCPLFGLSTDHGESLSQYQTLGNCVEKRDSINSTAAQEKLIEPFSVFHPKRQWMPGETPAVDRSNEALGFEMRVDPSVASSEEWNRPPLFGTQVVADAHENFHVFWTEIGEDERVKLLTSTIEVTSALQPQVDVRSAKDLTGQFVINVFKQHYDSVAAIFELDAALRNKSTSQIAYPNFVEVIEGRSDCGSISYLNPYGTSVGGNILYRVPKPPFKDYLTPGENTESIHFQIKVSGCEASHTDLAQAALSDTNRRRPARSLGYFPLAVRFRALATDSNSLK